MKSVIEQFKNVPTTAASDAQKGMNNLASSIKPLKDHYRIAGPARTVQLPVGDNKMLLKAMQEAEPGDILVVDAKGDTYRAIAGDFVVGMMHSLELGGLVVDGVIRDVEDIRALNFPVFAKGSAVASGGKNGPGNVNTTISCGGIAVQNGDIIIGDTDGVTVVPQSQSQSVLEAAQDKLAKDEARDSKISGNRTEIYAYLKKMTE
ncbi:MAG TPA: RraA family protein [Pseudogracilibacillus sp.]|nr:RraA family protein [Pseudogracilibacillus sp.]